MIQSTAERGRNTQIFLFVTCLVFLLVAFKWFSLHGTFQSSIDGDAEAKLILKPKSEMVTIYSIVAVLFHLLNSVIFIIWFRGVYDNVKLLGNIQLKHNSRLATMSWYFPVLNFYMPFQIFRNLRESYSAKSGKEISNQFLTIWWIIWCIGLLLSAFPRIALMETRSEELIGYGILSMVAGLIFQAISGFMLIAVIQKFTVAEKEILRG